MPMDFFKKKEEGVYIDELTSDKVFEFAKTHGQRGKKITALIGRHLDFTEAISSDIGKELLSGVMVQMEILLEKIIESKASKKDLIKYKMLRDLFNNWVERIVIFNQAKDKIRGI